MSHRNKTFAAVGLACLALVGPALAGEKKACEMEAEQCLEMMVQRWSGRGWVGIEMDKTEEGFWLLTAVVPGSPADDAGLQKGDQIRAMNDMSFRDWDEKLKKAHEAMIPGQKVVYTVHRDGQDLAVQVTLGNLPRPLLAQWIGFHMLEGHGVHEVEQIASDSP